VNIFVDEMQTTHFKGGDSEGRKNVLENEPMKQIREFKPIENYCFYIY
jgi:hypothetical protein